MNGVDHHAAAGDALGVLPGGVERLRCIDDRAQPAGGPAVPSFEVLGAPRRGPRRAGSSAVSPRSPRQTRWPHTTFGGLDWPFTLNRGETKPAACSRRRSRNLQQTLRNGGYHAVEV